MHQPVRRVLRVVLGRGQVMSNGQVGNNFAVVLELGGLGREALIQCGLDLTSDHYQCRKRHWGGTFKLTLEGHQLRVFGFKLRLGCGGTVRMNERACPLVRVSAVGVCSLSVRGLGMVVCFLCVCVRTVRILAWETQAVCFVRVYVYVCMYGGRHVQPER